MGEAVVRDGHILLRVLAIPHWHGEGKARHTIGLPRPQQGLILLVVKYRGGILRRVSVLQTEQRRVALHRREHGRRCKEV